MKHSLYILSLLALPLAATAQTEVEAYRPGVTVDGVCYYLPRTALRITVETETETTSPGEYYAYAYRFLRLKDVPTQTIVRQQIKSIKVEPYSLPDSEKAYTIRLKGRTLAPLVRLTRDGILLSVNAEADELPALPNTPADRPAPRHADARRYLSQETLAAGSKTKMAELIATQIQDVRESRTTLIKGEADNTPKDGAQLKLMLDELEQEATALEELFTGYTTRATHYSVFTYEPAVADTSEVLFRFSPQLGVVDAENYAGAPVYIRLQSLEKLPPTTPNPDTDKKKAKMETGVYYNVPARESVVIDFEGQTLFSEEYSMGQFGNVEILSATLFDKKNTFQATFDQITGSVRHVSE